MVMKQDEFLAKLSEVADWKIPETPRETSLNAKKKRGRKSNEESYMELREEIFHEEFGGINKTIPPMLVKLKHTACTCEDCGRHCPNGRQKEKKIYEANKIRHWRERCKTCGMTANPYTGEFDLDSTKASITWNSYLRDTKGTYQSKGNLAKEIIRKYPDTEDPL